MSIYTKTGDLGETSLFGGKRVLKSSARLNAYGAIDELNSFLGLLRAKLDSENDKNLIFDIQNSLFTVGAILATPAENLQNAPIFDENLTKKLENYIDELDKTLPKLKNFIVYGENETSAICHICRAVTRRAEREIVKIAENEKINENLLRYINRLSDFLFTFARFLLQKEGNEDFFWKK
ncbi:MAG: cob(I)yrinic acid a,c-diamide adenosyltransferase [Prevotellaceae bacterium]|jgi:cob(I)alamin adenosyltransferase|nr:cob(I)yrinic acid a,c-diamide adenosyltransferase [Prevotellaceae bacterium]